jgi:arylsulfatase A-like enzyme
VAIGLGGGSRGTPAPGTAGPNVIVVFLDTVRYDAVLDPEGRVLPGLPALARLRSESTAFTRAFSPSPWTLPAHLSAVTGLPPHQVGVSFDWQVYSRADETLAERFRRRGYRTAAVISNTFINAGTGFARGYDRFEQAQSGLDLCRTGPGSFADRIWPWFAGSICNWTASDVTRRALAQMDDADGPFFLTLNYMDAHDPYYVERSCGEPNGYAAAIRCLDRSLAPIVDWRSPRRPTVIAVTSDHGEQFGEHGLGHHGNSVYVQLLHVPLIVRGAEAGGARTDTQPISLSALPALVGGIDGLPQRGGPLLALLHPPASTGRRSEWSATDGAWHLIGRERGPESLYHLPSDPVEARDLAASPPADPAIARLRAAIQEMRREPKPDLRRFRSLGYVH